MNISEISNLLADKLVNVQKEAVVNAKDSLLPVLWAIGGGKGGTGKSFISSSIAVELARQGKKVILADFDFGAPNLHTFLGLGLPRKSIEDFIAKKNSLEEIILPTKIEGLSLIAGDVRTFTPKGFKYAQKNRFINNLKNSNCDIVVTDLGAGSMLSSLDIFSQADKKIVVVTPEPTSIENMYQYVKKGLLRSIEKYLSEKNFLSLVETEFKKQKVGYRTGFKDRLDRLKRISPIIERYVDKSLDNYKIHIAVNQIEEEIQTQTGLHIKNILKNYLCIDVVSTKHLKRIPRFWTDPSMNAEKRASLINIESWVKSILEGKIG